MIPAAFFKAHISGGVLGLSGIVFDQFCPNYFSIMSNKLRIYKIIFMTNHTKTQLYTILKLRQKLQKINNNTGHYLIGCPGFCCLKQERKVPILYRKGKEPHDAKRQSKEGKTREHTEMTGTFLHLRKL